jgi:plasmid stabilization system protein ParE
MARLIWTEPALRDLDDIAEYIALDDPLAASWYVQKVFDRVERLESHPQSGKRPPELPRSPYREVVVPPCRIFYRVEQDAVCILYVMRAEQLLRSYVLNQRNSEK